MELLLFTSPHCKPCVPFKPVVREVATSLDAPLRVIDAEDDLETAMRHRAMSFPTLIAVSSGVEVGRIVGTRSAVKLAEELRAFGF